MMTMRSFVPKTLVLLAWMSLAPISFAAAAETASLKAARDELQLQHFDKARAAAEQASKADPKDYRAYYYLAMAELGLGHQDLARAHVDKALALVPATARPSVEKLSGMITAQAAAASPAVIISCTFSGERRASYSAEPYVIAEKTDIMKIGAGTFQWWNEASSTWVGERCPPVANASDAWSINASCEFNERVLGYTYEAHELGADTVHTDAVQINRLTGAYTQTATQTYGPNQPKLPTLAGVTIKETRSGSCRATRDPAEAKPKF